MAYELKPSEEMQNKEKQLAAEKERYGDKNWSPEQGLPTYVDHSVSTAKGGAASGNRKIIYIVIGVLLLAGLVFGVIKGVQYIVGSGGEDISQYLGLQEAELADKLGLKFEQHNELAGKVQQYSGGVVTVRQGGDLKTIYIDGVQVGVSTDGRDYRFYGVGVNDKDVDVEGLLTFKHDGSFVVLNDLQGGRSTSYYYPNSANNTVLVIVINDTSHRVASLSFFTDMKLVTKNLSF